MIKKILNHSLIIRLACWLVFSYTRLCFITNSWQFLGNKEFEKRWNKKKPFILCFWHGRLLMMPYCWKKNIPIHMLISKHKDGQLISKTVRYLGIQSITGSTKHGGMEAMRRMLGILKQKECVGITPDGPRGPRMKCSVGIVNLAQISGSPIIPVTYSSTKRKIISSWDKFQMTLPFGSGVFIWGKPINVPRKITKSQKERIREKITNKLNNLTEISDALCGHNFKMLKEEGKAAK